MGQRDEGATPEEQGGRHGFLRKAGRIAVQSIIACGALCAASLLWWWFKGEHTPVRLADCFAIGGALGIGLGFVVMGGTRFGGGSWRYQRARSAGSDSVAEQSRQDRQARRGGYSTFLVGFIGGILTIGIGWLTYWVWG